MVVQGVTSHLRLKGIQRNSHEFTYPFWSAQALIEAVVGCGSIQPRSGRAPARPMRGKNLTDLRERDQRTVGEAVVENVLQEDDGSWGLDQSRGARRLKWTDSHWFGVPCSDR